MLLYENKKEKLLNFLKIGINPFKKFVATGEIKEDIGLVNSRINQLNKIKELIDNNANIVLPIIGETGIGKTHLYWALKNKLYYHNTIYISLENYKQLFYNIYSEFMEGMGPEVLRSITSALCNKWGALERKFGFFHMADIDKVKTTAYNNLSQNFEDNIALNDVIIAITSHQLNPYKKTEAERWLLGELMDSKDLSHLNLLYDLRKSSYAYTVLKIIIENSKLGTVLFIDDFEKIISLMKPEAALSIFEPEWLYGDIKASPDIIIAQKVLEKIVNLEKIKGLRIIITLNSTKSLDEVKKFIKELGQNISITFLEPIFLSNFNEDDVYEFYMKKMEEFLISINFLDFIEEYPEDFFPISKSTLKTIFNVTQGNPREIIKHLIKIFNEIIYSDKELVGILESYNKQN